MTEPDIMRIRRQEETIYMLKQQNNVLWMTTKLCGCMSIIMTAGFVIAVKILGG